MHFSKMNFIPNSKFYKSVFRLDPSTLASAKARIQSYKTGTPIPHDFSGQDFLKPPSAPDLSSKFSDIFPKDFFNATASSSKNEPSNCRSKESNIINDSAIASPKKNLIIIAFCEGRGNATGEIGLAIFDLSNPVLYLSQFSDDVIYTALITKLQINTPSELLVPKTMFDANAKSIEKINKIFFDLKITSLPRRHFNAEEGMDMLLTCGLTECRNDTKKFENKYYALSAASALLKYVQVLHSLEFLKNGLKIEFDGKFAQMVLDPQTCYRLELLTPIFHSKVNKACLLDVLDKTVTQIGRRQLRAKILEPYLDTKNILFVQEAIKDLLQSSKSGNAIGQISEILKRFANVDKILKIVINDRVENDVVKSVQTMLDKILILKSTIELIPDLHSILQPFESYTLYKACTNLKDHRFAEMLKCIDKVLRPETHFIRGAGQSFQRIHAVRPGLNQYLDLLRDSYNKLTDGMNDSINKLAAHHELPLRMNYTISKGFHIQLVKPRKKRSNITVPPEFILIKEKPNAIFLTTNDIMKSNIKLKDTTNELFICSEKIIKSLIEELVQYNEANYLLVDIIANLDVLVSYAKVSQTDGFCCPIFGEETKIVEARHIFLENSKSSKICVPNNIIATPDYNFFVITGPNMAGKTIYLKTIVLIQIIAQLGCYVPAKTAKLRICDKIFTRLGFEDKIEQNGSGFINELREIEYMLRNMTARSLIVIDELCRTTNPDRGFNLAWKICSKLCQFQQIDSQNSKRYQTNNFDDSENISGLIKHEDLLDTPMPHIYIATHFLGLTRLKDHFFNVVNLQVEAEEVIEGDRLSLKYTHKVKEGITTITSYGLKLAKMVGLREEILNDAYKFLNDIRLRSKENIDKPLESLVESIEEVDVLHKTLNRLFPNKSFEIQRQRDSFISIANFMNLSFNGDDSGQVPSQAKKSDVQVDDLMKEFCFKMYDFYADIAALKRHYPPYSAEEFRNKSKEVFKEMRNSLPLELQELLSTKDISSILEENNIKNIMSRQAEKNASPLFSNHTNSVGLKHSSEETEIKERVGSINPNKPMSFEGTSSVAVNVEQETLYNAKVIDDVQIIPPRVSQGAVPKLNISNQFLNPKKTNAPSDSKINRSSSCIERNVRFLGEPFDRRRSATNSERLNKTLDLGNFPSSQDIFED